MEKSAETQLPWFLQTSYPVLLPAHDALVKSQADFESFLRDLLDNARKNGTLSALDVSMPKGDGDDGTCDGKETTAVGSSTTNSTGNDAGQTGFDALAMDTEGPETGPDEKEGAKAPNTGSAFMDGLLTHGQKPKEEELVEGMMLTENGDLAHRSSQDALVDLFSELEDVVSGPRLYELLNAAWAADPLTTLKIIFNARSIHLGKSSRTTFYRCAGWLARKHPLTLVANLRWLSRPVVEKKAKKQGDDDELIVVNEPKGDHDPTRFDIQYGVAHGYWKDLLNILVLEVDGKLNVMANPRDTLNSENPSFNRGKRVRSRGGSLRGRGGALQVHRNQDKALEGRVEKTKVVDPEERRKETRDNRHKAVIEALERNPVYLALHMTVARLFAEQLTADLVALRGDDAQAKRNISLCGKWAPTHDHFHDRQAFIVSSIAEIMYPRQSLSDVVGDSDDRTTYLRHAREQYRKNVSALRKHLDVVERKITASKYDEIKYDRIPSIAMSKYTKLFIEKDGDRFEEYIDNVAQGKSRISGATLLPSTIMSKVRAADATSYYSRDNFSSVNKFLEHRVNAIQGKALDGQWNALVQRIRDSGTLESSIAVCDVSGSMHNPVFPDGTTPVDTAIGLSLLVAEVTKPPFGGAFITFSANPTVQTVDLDKSLMDKYRTLNTSEWSMNTDFVAVFEKLILPMALSNELKPDDMVKRIFVFSDMQFDAAQWNRTWPGSYDRIKKLFADHGYQLPELVFWNLAGGRAGYAGGNRDPAAPKPVTATEEKTALVSGYSQGMLKVFLANGTFEDPESQEGEDEDEAMLVDEDGEVEPEKKTEKKDPMALVKKAVGHKAYDMLVVVD